jgi:hypothetical protein
MLGPSCVLDRLSTLPGRSVAKAPTSSDQVGLMTGLPRIWYAVSKSDVERPDRKSRTAW